MLRFDGEPLQFEDGVMFGRVTVDGAEIRAGITLEAFEMLIERAGFDADRDFGQVMVANIIDLLRPTIEAHLQAKHFAGHAEEGPLVIEKSDLVVH